MILTTAVEFHQQSVTVMEDTKLSQTNENQMEVLRFLKRFGSLAVQEHSLQEKINQQGQDCK